MKFSSEILINKPLDYVIHKMNNIENKKHWHKDLMYVEHLYGVPGEFGCKLKLVYNFKGKQMEVVETITKQDFPKEFHATYATEGIRNHQKNKFKSASNSQTLWICNNEYTPTNFLMNAMLIFMPNAYRKQTYNYMENFKNFIEYGISKSNA